ncbi:unnamed protein product [Boreogadus saida]
MRWDRGVVFYPRIRTINANVSPPPPPSPKSGSDVTIPYSLLNIRFECLGRRSDEAAVSTVAVVRGSPDAGV